MRKFQIPETPKATIKSIRFPNKIIAKVEEKIIGTDCTFSAFAVEAVRVILENMKEDGK